MNNLPRQLVAETFGLTLESLAFIFPQPMDATASAPEEAMLLQLALSRNEPITLELVAGRPFAQLFAANLLGTTPDDPQIAQPYGDALKELINIAGGGLLSLMLDHDSEPSEMGIPSVQPFSTATEWEAFVTSPGACVFDAEGNTIAFRLRGAA